jgi:hypothetical protein
LAGSVPALLKTLLIAPATLCWFWFSAVPAPSAAERLKITSVGV